MLRISCGLTRGSGSGSTHRPHETFCLYQLCGLFISFFRIYERDPVNGRLLERADLFADFMPPIEISIRGVVHPIDSRPRVSAPL